MKRAILFLLLFLFALPASAQVSLAWDASATPGVTYNVYRSKVSGVCVLDVTAPGCTKLNAAPVSGLAYTDATAVNGKFFYTVRAVDADGLPSVASNELVVFLPPAPPTNLRRN
jgi:hypothetical protein